jgi:hypothetical protein
MKTRLLSLAVLVALAAGCGPSGPARFDVSGEVSYRGKPLPAGILIFDPDPKRGGDGPQGYAHVKEGKYDTRDRGRPVTVGPALVRIQGFDGVAQGEMLLGKKLFPDVIVDAELDPSRSTLDFTVPASAAKP